MTDEALTDRARRLGIMPEYEGTDGTNVTPPPRTVAALLDAIGHGDETLDADLRLQAPAGVRCYMPDGDTRSWGVAVQLYQLRSARNWGIGDFEDLRDLVHLVAAEGADFIGLNPLHAPFLSDPRQCSPFRPSDRRMLNPFYIAVDQVPGFDPQMVDPCALKSLRDTDLVNYEGVARQKLATLRAIWNIQEREADVHDDPAVARWALFEVASAHHVAAGQRATWNDWPQEWQHPEGRTVQEFAARHEDEIAFHIWLQSVTADQLLRVKQACRQAGMSIGLYFDFAVGEDPGGAGTWGAEHILRGARIGAPPDQFSAQGQDWGLAPLSPTVMASTGSAPFRDVIRPMFSGAGAVRIDHAMGLWQIFMIPPEGCPTEGTYVRYPLGDTLTVLAELSREHRTLVIGEDLGNVPVGFREVMEKAGILSYQVLIFERDGETFIPASDYPPQSLACVSTHDLPPFQSWWLGEDNRLREALGLSPHEDAALVDAERESDRLALIDALKASGFDVDPSDFDNVVVAVHGYLATAPSRLLVARLEDMAGGATAVNLPGTTDDLYPNWRPKLDATFSTIIASPLAQAITRELRAARPRNPV